jgi:uncharacterized membrane protein HdeD (DUF308 family)
MQSIAAVPCGAFCAALSLQDWAWACHPVRPRRCRSQCRKISEGRSTISSKKLKPWLPGRRLGPFAIPDAIIGGGDVGSAGGIVAVVTVNGVGGDHHLCGCSEENDMTTYDSSSRMEVSLPAPPFWICVLLGLVMIGAGILVLGDIMLVTLISTIFIGWVSIIAGAFEIVHAFWTKGWGGFVWQVLLGILYVAFGIVLVGQPVASALILTYVLGLVLLISGFVRILLGISHWREAGWIMLLSGAFGVLAGLVILTGFPATGLWVLGFLLGIDLISHGIGWLAYAWRPTTRSA